MTPEEKNMKLLLVDDEEGIRRVLGITLLDMGYGVITSSNGQEALKLFETHQPAIVLADIKMPGLDGIDLLKAIKSRQADTEVIMITGHGDMEAAIFSLKLEATDFITKPIHAGALEIALKRAKERIALRAQLAHYTEHLELLVAEKTRQLLEAERMAAVGQTIAGLSHTIKNIAGGLKGGSFCVEKGLELDEPRYLRQGWEIVKGNVEKIARLSLDMIHFAKTTQHQARSCDPNRPLNEAAELIRSQAEAAGVELRMELSPGLGEVALDPETICQALHNLALNAVESFAGIEDKRRREVILKTAQPAGWGVAYYVIDNGSGMDEAARAQWGERFFTTKGSDGTGIGVMMTKYIVDKHRGEMNLQTTPGAGTQVVVRLPKRDEGTDSPSTPING
ncbi:MAG: response regulator [Desulfobacteraceae bacterium]|nr:response regulator [Desulfobacteraceae bacterium]